MDEPQQAGQRPSPYSPEGSSGIQCGKTAIRFGEHVFVLKHINYGKRRLAFEPLDPAVRLTDNRDPIAGIVRMRVR